MVFTESELHMAAAAEAHNAILSQSIGEITERYQ